jgi:hypothetical protein
MKKLLILTLVLCLASMAQADLKIKLYYPNGSAYDGKDLNVSDYLEIRLEAVGGDTGDSNPCLYNDETYGVIAKTGGTCLIPPAPTASAFLDIGDGTYSARSNLVNGLGATEDGIVGAVSDFTASPPYANGEYFTTISFHCEAIGDAVLKLVNLSNDDWDVTTATSMDTVTIHQIPEPATMLLLGLGSLLLRRRK